MISKKMNYLLSGSFINILLAHSFALGIEQPNTLLPNQRNSTMKSDSIKIDPISPIINNRFSGYEFDPTKTITHDHLKLLLDAARLTPSSYNEQPWVFILCDKHTHQAAYQKALNSLVEFNQNWAKNAPLLIIAVSQSVSSHNNHPNKHAQYDTGAASLSLVLQATGLGLMTHQMAGFDEKKIREAFSIPADFIAMSVIAVGYPAATQKPTERKRKEFSNNFFIGEWGVGFTNN